MERTGAGRIDKADEREKSKAEERKRLAAALRANLKKRKAGRNGDTGAAAPKPAAGED